MLLLWCRWGWSTSYCLSKEFKIFWIRHECGHTIYLLFVCIWIMLWTALLFLTFLLFWTFPLSVTWPRFSDRICILHLIYEFIVLFHWCRRCWLLLKWIHLLFIKCFVIAITCINSTRSFISCMLLRFVISLSILFLHIYYFMILINGCLLRRHKNLILWLFLKFHVFNAVNYS